MPLIFLMHAVFASCFTIGKSALQYGQPFFLTGVRMIFAGLLLLAFLLIYNRKAITFKKELILPLLGLAVFNIFLTNAGEFWALQFMTSSKTCFLYSLTPFVSSLLSLWIFSEKFTGKKWLGLIIGVIGMTPIVLKNPVSEIASGQLFFFSKAEGAMILAVIATSLGWIILRKLLNTHKVSLVYANSFSMILGGIMALAVSLISEQWTPIPSTNYMRFFSLLILLTFVSNIVGYNLYGFLLKRFTASLMSFTGFVQPIIVAIYGWVFLRETVSLNFFIGMAILSVGIYFFYKEELNLGYITKK